MKRSLPLLLTLACSAFLMSCGDETATQGDKPIVFVAAPPYQGLLEQIAGDFITVETLVSEGDDPHSYSPTPRKISDLSKASLYFTAELPFEKSLHAKLKEGNPNVKIINLVAGLDRRAFKPGEHDHDHAHDDHDHAHDDHDHAHDDHDHGSEELDPHVWLAPALLIEQVRKMTNSLGEILSEEEKAKAQKNSESLVKSITDTDKELAKTLAPLRGEAFYVYHGAFGYFADAYGLKQIPVEINGRSPEPKRLTALIKQAQSDEVKVIFVQPQFDQTSARSLADSIGGSVVSIDPLAKDPVQNLRDIAAKIGAQ